MLRISGGTNTRNPHAALIPRPTQRLSKVSINSFFSKFQRQLSQPGALGQSFINLRFRRYDRQGSKPRATVFFVQSGLVDQVHAHTTNSRLITEFWMSCA